MGRLITFFLLISTSQALSWVSPFSLLRYRYPIESLIKTNSLIPKDWHLTDYRDDLLIGINAKDYELTYPEPKNNPPIVVAIIDTGVQIEHPDLQGKIWTNQNEIPNNGYDDDGNGYIDDYHGWNFLGEQDYDSSEIVRRAQYLIKNNHNSPELIELKSIIQTKRDNLLYKFEKLRQDHTIYQTSLNAIQQNSSTNLDIFKTAIEKLEKKYGTYQNLNKLLKNTQNKLKYVYNLNYKQSSIDFFSGNEKVNLGPNLVHGTHVAGIIAAIKENQIGINGIATNVKIMPLKAIPIGAERDEKIAQAINYAIDHNAKIINLSFNKYLQENNYFLVQRAIERAQKKDILIVHSAGNESLNLDNTIQFPYFKNLRTNKSFDNWISVGATGPHKDESLIAHFSNYGKYSVDIFAPGVDITSLGIDNNIIFSGTSMSAPIVSACAAVLLNYAPDLKPKQLKKILLDSGNKILNLRINNKYFTEYSRSGKIINLKAALNELYSNPIYEKYLDH